MEKIIKTQKEFKLPQDVLGSGIGYKIKDGKKQEKKVLTFFVKEKKPKSQLSDKDILPSKINDIETDVIEVGDIKALNIYKKKYRPLKPGISIGNKDITVGTYAYPVIDIFKKPFLLSNAHVFAPFPNLKLNSQTIEILQPGPTDGGTEKIGELIAYSKIKKKNNLIDAALCSIDNKENISLFYPSNEKITGINEKPLIGETFKKEGRTTGYTLGKLLYTNVSISINYKHGSSTFDNQYLFSNMSKGGDSGSLIRDQNNKAVGLLFAGSDKITVANPIKTVLNYFEVDLLLNLEKEKKIIEEEKELIEELKEIKQDFYLTPMDNIISNIKNNIKNKIKKYRIYGNIKDKNNKKILNNINIKFKLQNLQNNDKEIKLSTDGNYYIDLFEEEKLNIEISKEGYNSFTKTICIKNDIIEEYFNK